MFSQCVDHEPNDLILTHDMWTVDLPFGYLNIANWKMDENGPFIDDLWWWKPLKIVSFFFSLCEITRGYVSNLRPVAKRDGWKRELSLGTAETGRANGDSMWLLAMVQT